MTDEELADELIGRLNRMLSNDDIRADVGRLIINRIPCSQATADHPTIQVTEANRQETATAIQKFFGPEFGPIVADAVGNHAYAGPVVSFLGLLNGIVGIMPGRLAEGYIAASFDEGGRLTHFRRSGQP